MGASNSMNRGLYDPPIFDEDETLDPVEAIQQVISISGCDEQELFKSVRGPVGNPARALAAWWIVEGAGVSNKRACELLNMKPAAVCRAVRRVKTEGIRNPNSDVFKWAYILTLNREIEIEIEKEITKRRDLGQFSLASNI